MLTRAPDNRAVALKLAAAGYFVFPCEEADTSRGKAKKPKPQVYWLSAATTDAAKINRWWDEWPDALVGLHCGKCGFVITDADRHGGPDGVSAWDKLIAEHGDPGAPSVSTPSNGVHYYFRQPEEGEPLKNARGNLPKGIDVRGATGYVIAPGSTLPDGRVYELHGDLVQAPTIPGWLVDIIERDGVDEIVPASAPVVRDASPDDDEERLLSALDTIAPATRDIRVAIGMALKDHYGQSGFEIWERWLSSAPNESKPAQRRARWKGFKGHGLTVATVFHFALEAGWKPTRWTDEDARLAEEGGRIARAFIESARTREEPSGDSVENNKKSRLYLVPFDEIKLSTAPRYLVKEVIPSTGLTVVWGPPKQGKSFWVFDIAMHIALGWEYRGKRVKKGIVVYGCFEGQDGFEARKAAFEREFLGEHQDGVPFFLEPVSLNLVKEAGELIAVIRGTLGDDVPALIVLDTLNRSFDGSESDDKDMTAYVKAADALRHAFECAVLIVHHCGHDATRPRGHTALLGAVDAQIKVAKEGDGSVVSLVEFMKDGPSGACFSSTLDQVTVGVDDDGDDITSCIVKAADASVISPKARSLSESDLHFHEAFVEASQIYQHPEKQDRPGLVAIPLLNVRDAFESHWATGEEPMTREQKSAMRSAWKRALTKGRKEAFSVVVFEGCDWIFPHA